MCDLQASLRIEETCKVGAGGLIEIDFELVNLNKDRLTYQRKGRNKLFEHISLPSAGLI